MRFLPSLFLGLSVFAFSASASADDAGPGPSPTCTTRVAPAPGEAIPLNSPALAIAASAVSNVALTGEGGLFVFVTDPKDDPAGTGAQLLTPIGAAAGRHDLSFVASCANAEHHDVTFGPEVAYPTSIGRIVRADELAPNVTIEIELSPEAAAYVPVASFTATIDGMTLAPPSAYGTLPPDFTRSGRTLTASAPAYLLDPYCHGDPTAALSIGLTMHVAGMTDDPTPLQGTLVHSCATNNSNANGGLNGGPGSGPCPWTGGRTCPDGGDSAPLPSFDEGNDVVVPNHCACAAVGLNAGAGTPFAFVTATLFAVAAFFRRATRRR